MIFMTANYRPRRGWILAATIAGVVLTARLGVWQLSRAQQKEDLQAAIATRAALAPIAAAALARDAHDAEAQLQRRAQLRGHWLAARTVFLDNRQMDGRPGFYVLTPLQLEGRPEAIVVQRGWVARDFVERTRLPAVPTPDGPVELHGRIAPPPARLYEFAAGASGVIRQNLDLTEFARETGLVLLPMSLLQTEAPAGANDGLRRDWPQPAVDVHKNLGYAAQWFALAALMTGLYVWFQLVRPRLRRAR
jgi:surfeit locus 1 family protein